MIDVYVMVGSRGALGIQIAAEFALLRKPVLQVSASQLVAMDAQEFADAVAVLLGDVEAACPGASHIGLVLAHRYRGTDILAAVKSELAITRDLVWQVSRNVDRLHVAVLGSITGRFVDDSSPEAYHYAKDVQKSIVRQSVSLANVAMNVIELSWFEKHPTSMATPSYRRKMGELRDRLGHNNLPTAGNIAQFIRQLLDCSLPPRGQSIVYDGGYGVLQR